jgi:hypothetical protein
MPQSLKFDYPVRLIVPPVIDGQRAALDSPARGPNPTRPSLPPVARSPARRRRSMLLGSAPWPATSRATLPAALLAASDQPINSTLGWDTVFAVQANKVNDHFAASNLYPKDFSGTFNGSLYSATITGNFGAWTIALGGSGAIVNLSIPVASGTMAIKNGNNFALAGATLFVEVKLNYLPQPNQGTKGTPNNLQVANKPMNETGHVAEVIQVKIPNQTDPTVLAAVQGCFQDFFDKNLARVSYVFNTVNLNAVADTAAFQWLKPTTTEYAYFEPANATSLDQAVLGVLCMVNNDSPGNNTNEMAPGAIPQQNGVSSEAGFSINNQLFLRQMVLPVLPASFNANNAALIGPDFFTITNNDTEIVNTRPIPMRPVVYGGLPYYPECKTFKLTLDTTELQIYTLVHVNISPGIDAYVEQTAYYKPSVKTDSKGNQFLDFVKSRDPDPPHQWQTVATGIIITEIIVGVIGAFFAAWGFVFLETVDAIIFAILIALLFGIAAAIPQLIKEIASQGVIGKLPVIADLAANATSEVKWTGGHDFRIAFVQLNGTFQMAGAAFPAKAAVGPR